MSSSQVSDATGGGFSARSLIKLFLALCLACLGIVLRVGHVHLLPLQALLLFGSSVLAAAFLLAWAAEALQVDISQGLAMAVLAFIAVLPEYAVDLYFAASAAHTPSHAQYAAANMTGSNRLLIGVGWSLVALCSIYATMRGRGQAKAGGTTEQSEPAVTMNAGFGVDLTVLAIATVWSFAMPLFGAIAIWNGAGLLVLFAFYVWRVSSNDEAEPELAGVAQELGALPKIPRRTSVILILMVAAGTLLAAAEPFAESLIGSGEQLGIDKFLLVQWLAPLASEAPELLVATIFALRGHGAAGMSALLSSKVNQWTLLVGTLPIAYSIALGHVGALVLDARQTEELILTASQSMLGVSFLLNGRLSGKKAVLLLLLFLVQLPFPQANVRYGLSALYLVLAAVQIVRHRRFIGQHLKLTFNPPKPSAAAGSAL
ncbi:MAG: sodium:proton exchanger [Deltaproteobacteria bacterium]|nr:sodium:proton exchanger [Deltaproteobacteria bacterium]